MPCYEVRTVSVEFHAEHLDVLQAAVKALGWTCVVNAKGDRVNVQTGCYEPSFIVDLGSGVSNIREDQQDRLNELKRAYAQETAKKACKALRWKVSFAPSGTQVKGKMTKVYM